MATEYGLEVSVDTIRCRLDEVGLFAGVLDRKPFIRTKNRKIRLQFARDHQSSTTREWNKYSGVTNTNLICFEVTAGYIFAVQRVPDLTTAIRDLL